MMILLIEDDGRILSLLDKTLSGEGHRISTARGGADGWEMIQVGGFDLIILDVTLPQMDGFTVVTKMRAEGVRTPVLFLTARDAPADVVKGLDLGADDYVKKPFFLHELLARVRALGRRGKASESINLQVEDLTLDRARREAVRATKSIALSPKEYVVLELLMRKAGRAVSRDELIETGWGLSSDATGNTVEALISSLRTKIDHTGIDHTGPAKLLKTVRGFGYMISDRGSA